MNVDIQESFFCFVTQSIMTWLDAIVRARGFTTREAMIEAALELYMYIDRAARSAHFYCLRAGDGDEVPDEQPSFCAIADELLMIDEPEYDLELKFTGHTRHQLLALLEMNGAHETYFLTCIVARFDWIMGAYYAERSVWLCTPIKDMIINSFVKQFLMSKSIISSETDAPKESFDPSLDSQFKN